MNPVHVSMFDRLRHLLAPFGVEVVMESPHAHGRDARGVAFRLRLHIKAAGHRLDNQVYAWEWVVSGQQLYLVRGPEVVRTMVDCTAHDFLFGALKTFGDP